MDEFINRKDAFEILQSRLDSISQMSYLNMDWHELEIMRDAIEHAIDDVGEVPSADVQPVVHAYWIELPKALNPNENPCKCSNCGHILSFMNYYPKSKYCPNCGADMGGDTNGRIHEQD